MKPHKCLGLGKEFWGVHSNFSVSLEAHRFGIRFVSLLVHVWNEDYKLEYERKSLFLHSKI